MKEGQKLLEVDEPQPCGSFYSVYKIRREQCNLHNLIRKPNRAVINWV